MLVTDLESEAVGGRAPHFFLVRQLINLLLEALALQLIQLVVLGKQTGVLVRLIQGFLQLIYETHRESQTCHYTSYCWMTCSLYNAISIESYMYTATIYVIYDEDTLYILTMGLTPSWASCAWNETSLSCSLTRDSSLSTKATA